MMYDDLIQYLVRESNRFGRRGMKIIAWIPPRSAGDNPHGSWVYAANERSQTAAEGDD